MTIDTDKLLENAVADAIRNGLKSKFEGYNSPLDPLIKATIERHQDSFRKLLDDAVGACINDAAFREEIATATRHSLAKILVKRFGGEIEKQVNVLKSDPTTRARIVLALEEIVKSRAS